MSKRWMLTAFGKDRPGMVAQVTKVLFDLHCNLEDSAMTRLAGEFVIMLTFSAPPSLTQAKLEPAFRPVSKRLGLAVHLKPLSSSPATGSKGASYAIAVYGADKPGIVYRVAAALAGLGINITDVSTQRSVGKPLPHVRSGRRSGASPLYLLVLEVQVPKRISPESLERRLKALAKPLGVYISLRSADTNVL
jgi:glycine cleavage system transcriptional repressor